MADYADREHFIPLRKQELVELLASEKGLPQEDAEQFRQFCRLVTATFHFEYNQRLEGLKTAYAPFDPDADTQSLVTLTPEERQERLDGLFRDFAWLLERANFTHLSRADLESALAEQSDWGLRMDVDFSIFEQFAVFARGDTTQQRARRRLRKLYRKEETSVPIFRRLVLILKLRPHRRLSRDINTDHVYLKVFKDIPQADIEMLLPGSRVRFSLFDRSRIGLPFLSGLGMALWKIGSEIMNLAHRFLDDVLGFVGNPTLAFWGLTTGALGYGYKSWYGYQHTKQRYHLNLTQSLYYRNLDSNAGVLFRLLDEAEEQECREAILGYYFLWRHAGEEGWTGDDLDDAVEKYLERYAHLKVDFEIGDALQKLEQFGLVERAGDRYRARPLLKALEALDCRWDNYFRYNRPEPEQCPVA